MSWMPGKSHSGPLPPLTDAERDLAKRLSDHVWMLAGDIGPRSLTSSPQGLAQAGGYIEHMLAAAGYAVSRQVFSVEVFDQNQRKITGESISFASASHQTFNIIAEKVGRVADSGIIIVGAHYDSVYDCPAANDNGSGVAALLEIARALRDEHFDRTIRFVAFTNEEPPFFRTEQMGSYKYAEQCHQNKEQIAGMVCLETIGFYSDKPDSQKFPHPIFKMAFPTKGNFVSFISNLQSSHLLKRSVKAFRQSVQFPSQGLALPLNVKGVSFSDQDNFWQRGYPAIMVTDTAFYRYPHYHEASDTPDKLDYETFARVVVGLAGVARDLSTGR